MGVFVDGKVYRVKIAGIVGAVWGAAGVLWILAFAVYRLAPVAAEAIALEFQWYHWLVFCTNTFFMMYSEGYKGFQLAFSPRVAARAKYLMNHPTVIDILLAPAFCVGYYNTSTHRKTVVYVLTAGIIVLVWLVRMLEQPWRGIIDAGVVVGLSWGIVATTAYVVYAFVSPRFDHDPEVGRE